MRRVSRKCVVLSEPNRDNPLVFLFSLLVREERMGIRFSLGCLRRLCLEEGLKIEHAGTMGAILPNKTTVPAIRFLRLFDNVPLLGFYSFVVTKK